MYLACRHIKPGGLRCKSPALRGHAFCYYHARLHSATKLGFADNFKLQVPEDSAAIQESLGRLFNAILTSSIDSKKTAQLLWGLQIASNNLPRKAKADPKSVLSVTRNKEGVELAPVLRVCNPLFDGETCEDAESCQVCSAFNALMGRSEEGTDDDDGEDKPAAVKPPSVNDKGEILDMDEFMRQRNADCDDDGCDDDDDDEEDGKTLLGTLRILTSLKESLDLDE